MRFSNLKFVLPNFVPAVRKSKQFAITFYFIIINSILWKIRDNLLIWNIKIILFYR